MKSLKRPSLSTKVYNRLLTEIITGLRKAGDKLGEEELSREYRVSRTPVREAIQRLTQEELIDRKPRCGCFVKKLNQDDIKDLFECRQILECLCLEQGFGGIELTALDAIEEVLDKAETLPEADKAELSLRADEMLHQLVAGICPNRHLAAILLSLQTRCLPFRTFRSQESSEIDLANRERRQIIDSIKTGHKDKAIDLLKEHILQFKLPER